MYCTMYCSTLPELFRCTLESTPPAVQITVCNFTRDFARALHPEMKTSSDTLFLLSVFPTHIPPTILFFLLQKRSFYRRERKGVAASIYQSRTLISTLQILAFSEEEPIILCFLP